MFRTYLESAEGIQINRARVIKELKKHGITSQEEIDECFSEIKSFTCDGVQMWDAYEVLEWLGY